MVLAPACGSRGERHLCFCPNLALHLPTQWLPAIRMWRFALLLSCAIHLPFRLLPSRLPFRLEGRLDVILMNHLAGAYVAALGHVPVARA